MRRIPLASASEVHLGSAGCFPEARGHVFFSAKDVEGDRTGAMARVVADHYKRPAEPPRDAISVTGTGVETGPAEGFGRYPGSPG